jgi:hypothetical protein
VGFFKDIKSTLGSATEAAKASRQAAEAQATAAQAGLTEGTYDPNDPGFDPVEGVTLEQYAKLCKAVAGAGLKDEAEVDQWSQQQGLEAGQFKRVSDEFTKRNGHEPGADQPVSGCSTPRAELYRARNHTGDGRRRRAGARCVTARRARADSRDGRRTPRLACGAPCPSSTRGSTRSSSPSSRRG